MALYLKTSADKVFDVLTVDQIDLTGNGTGKYSFELSGVDFTASNETAWGVNKNVYVKVDDASDRNVTVNDFVYASIDTSAAAHSAINVFGAKRGDIITGSGDDIVNVFLLNSLNAGAGDFSNPANYKNSIFNIDTGGGNDTISFDTGDVGPGLNVNISQFTVTLIHAGGGNDTIDMKDHVPVVVSTVDTIFGDDGNDTINAGGGNDELHGGNDADSIFGESGNDKVFGDAGNDSVNGGSGSDTVNGGADDDTVAGQDGNDTLHGDGGNDKLLSGTGSDVMFGDAGADRFVISNTDLILDDSVAVKVATFDTIADFNGGDGDLIDVQKPSDWAFSTNGVDGFLTNSTLPAGSEIHLTGVTAFNFDWLV
jgi:Ca2+-binding RTX toxin-like protein